jgi:hypothetical protein
VFWLGLNGALVEWYLNRKKGYKVSLEDQHLHRLIYSEKKNRLELFNDACMTKKKNTFLLLKFLQKRMAPNDAGVGQRPTRTHCEISNKSLEQKISISWVMGMKKHVSNKNDLEPKQNPAIQSNRGVFFRRRTLTRQSLCEFPATCPRSEQAVFVRDELGVFGHENLARGTQIEIFGLFQKELAVNARPYQTAIGIDVDFGHAEFRGGQIFVFVDALGTFFRALPPAALMRLTSSCGTLG